MFKLRVPFQLSEVQFNVDLTDCAVRRPSGPCKELTRGGGPALLVPLWPVLQSPSQAGTAGLGQRRLLCYHQAACVTFSFDSLVSLKLTKFRRGRERRLWLVQGSRTPTKCFARGGRSLAVHFILDMYKIRID